MTAATSLAEERVRGSLDVLMTTPLSTRQIVLGKWLGSFRHVPPLAILPGLVILGCAKGASWRGPGFVVMVAYVLASGAAVTSLGLAAATWCSRLGRAVGLTVAGYVLATVGWILLVVALTNPGFGERLIIGSPFGGAIMITIQFCERRMSEHFIDSILSWTFTHSLAAVLLLVATLASFNRCLGRVETGLFSSGHRP
ncbi:MAG: ABC transporter permease [Singulisphaera sp.]